MEKIEFSNDDKVKSNFFKFKKLNDYIQGTLIDKYEQEDRMPNAKSGLQWIYEIKAVASKQDGVETEENDTIIKVGGKLALDSQLKNVGLGQIIEIRFVEEKKPSKPGLNGAKILQVFARPGLVDKEWLAQHNSTNTSNSDVTISADEPEESNVANVDLEEKSNIVGDSEEQDQLDMIYILAEQVLGIKDPKTNETETKMKIMEATGLAFLKANYISIIEKLKEQIK